MSSTKALNLRIEDAARERLDALAKRKPYSIISRHKLALMALDLGIEALAKDPQLLLRGEASDPQPKRPRRVAHTAAGGKISVLTGVGNDT